MNRPAVLAVLNLLEISTRPSSPDKAAAMQAAIGPDPLDRFVDLIEFTSVLLTRLAANSNPPVTVQALMADVLVVTVAESSLNDEPES